MGCRNCNWHLGCRAKHLLLTLLTDCFGCRVSFAKPCFSVVSCHDLFRDRGVHQYWELAEVEGEGVDGLCAAAAVLVLD